MGDEGPDGRDALSLRPPGSFHSRSTRKNQDARPRTQHRARAASPGAEVEERDAGYAGSRLVMGVLSKPFPP
jgi:hypothetical protein